LRPESHPLGAKYAGTPPYSWKPLETDYHGRWLDILSNYTDRNLTRSEDMLPAIAGIANRIQAHTNNEYIAGVFRSALPRALLWKRQYLGPYLVPTAVQTTPTWSWASMLGDLVFESCYSDPRATCARVQDVSVQPSADGKGAALAPPAQIMIRAPISSVEKCDVTSREKAPIIHVMPKASSSQIKDCLSMPTFYLQLGLPCFYS
jgi:hypothetical protein